MARPQFSDFHQRNLLITLVLSEEREKERNTADVFVFCEIGAMKQKKKGNFGI
jgi:hypothetical protein